MSTGLQPDYPDFLFLIYDYKNAASYGDLSNLLEVGYPPELILVGGDGYVTDIWNGYVDEGTINQGLADLEAS